VPVERIFYDGRCGLCHGFVRFVARRDDPKERFRFAPLGGETFRALLAANQRTNVPDSLVVLTSGGQLLTRSRAVFHVLSQLGWPWRVAASMGRIVPSRLADRAYDACASLRNRFLPAPRGSCPVLPDRLRRRFDP